MIRRIVILALIACYGLAGCGQKGPLKLPSERDVSEADTAVEKMPEEQVPETEPTEAGQNGNGQQ